MARLFSKDYHKLSSSWYFNHAIIPLEKGDLWYWLAVDEAANYQMRFFPSQEKTEYFSEWVEILYNPETMSILKHECAECESEDNCRHYLSLLRYSYLYLSTDLFDEKPLQTCDGDALIGSPRWLDSVYEARLSLEGIFDPSTDKIRIYHDSYKDLNMPELIKILQNQESSDLALQENYQVLDLYELKIFEFLQSHRAAYSKRSLFWSIYKRDFPRLLALLRNYPKGIEIRENKELLLFEEAEYPLNIRISQSSDGYSVFPVFTEPVSMWYASYPSWIFIRNHVYRVFLPLNKELIDTLFQQGLFIGETDLIYYRSIVHKELLRRGIYLDFDADIKLPTIIDSMPASSLQISPRGDKILMEAFLHYEDKYQIPLSVLRFGKPLVLYPLAEDEEAWFQIPHQIFSRVEKLLSELPPVELDMWEQKAQLVFPQSSFEALKKLVFNLDNSEWEIIIADELSRDFITKIPLEVEIVASRSGDIDWFSYQVNYRYRDLKFSHAELKKYFKKEEQLLYTVDGRIFFISNPRIFEEAERLISNSDILSENTYRARIMNLPYYHRLREENLAFRIISDGHLDNMFRDLGRRHLEISPVLPFYLQTVLRGYQKAGVAWINMLAHYQLNGILADEMGLGKTIQALSVILASPPDTVSMVICPKTLLYNWAAEIEKFHTNIPYAIVEGNKEGREQIHALPNVRLFLIGYSMVLSDLEILKDKEFEWIVLDEAQNIKNVSAQRTAAIKKLKSRHRLALSGTPMENKITELWSIMDFLMPGYLGSLKRFKQNYLVQEDELISEKSLHRTISPFLLRRVKKEVLLELPDKQEQIAWCKLGPVQEKLYLQIIENVQKKLSPNSGEKMNYIHILSALTKLRQLCNHPHLASNDIMPHPELSPKLELLIELVQDAIAGDHKVLVFSQFVQMLKIIRQSFDALNIPYSYLDGKTKDRQAQIRNFESKPEIKLFLISLKTGGTGLNLTAADTVILYDPWWNPMVENQAIDRAHRIGQSRKVQVFRLITKNTVEEKILGLQKNKLDVFNEVIEGGMGLLKSFSREELEALFYY